MQHQIQVHSFSQRNCFLIKDARVHYVVLKQQPQPHTPPPEHRTTPPTQVGVSNQYAPSGSVMCRKPGNQQLSLLFQDPTVCQTPPTTTQQSLMNFSSQPQRDGVLDSDRHAPAGTYFIDIPPLSNSPRNIRSGNESLLLAPPTINHAVNVVVFGAP